MNPKTTTPADPFDRDLARSSQYIDSGWDEIGGDPLEDLVGVIDKTLFEDRDW